MTILSQRVAIAKKARRVHARMKVARSKYGNVPKIVDGIRFASKLEAKRYGELKLLERAGEINGLQVHPRFPLNVSGIHICAYIADFSYLGRGAPEITVEDTKGVITADCRIKLALMKACHGIEVKLIKARAA